MTGPRLDHVVVLGTDLEKTAQVYTGVLGRERYSITSGLRRDWMGMSHGPHAWIDGNGKGFWIEVIAPASPAKTGVLQKFGDGALIELDAEVKDIEAFYDQLKAKGITMTAGDSTPLPAGTKALTVKATGDRYAYIPLDRSEGMRILIFQRGPGATSIFQHRDNSWKH